MPLSTRTLVNEKLLDEARGLFRCDGGDLVGLEVEWPVHLIDDAEARPPVGALKAIAAAAHPGSGHITIEPGGQIEVSTLPATSLDEALRLLSVDEAAIAANLARVGMRMTVDALDIGRDPTLVLSHPRYPAMKAFYDASGPAGRWMMCNTASLQVNISNDRFAPLTRWRVLNLISPVLIAMFANSPGVDSTGRSWVSLRQGIWGTIDAGRTRPVPTNRPPAEAWMDYALAADVFYLPVEGSGGAEGTALAPGFSFAQWMESGHEVGWPTIEDFRYHLSTLFPPVRPRGWLELRVIDALPPKIRNVAALTVAVATRREVFGELLSRLPDTSRSWTTAAQLGLGDPLLADAATVLSDVVRRNVGLVTHDPALVAQLHDFVASYTANGRSPGWGRTVDLPFELPIPSAWSGPELNESAADAGLVESVAALV